MINRIIDFSINNKFIIGLLTLALIGAGIYSMTQVPIDAVPDITNNQVQVITQSPNLGTEDIEQFGKQISMHIAALNPMVIDKKDIKDDIIEKEKEIIEEELKNLGKPQEIAEKISLGKINKFKKDNSLLTQDWVMDPKLKVKDVLNKVDSKNLKIKDFIRIKIGE